MTLAVIHRFTFLEKGDSRELEKLSGTMLAKNSQGNGSSGTKKSPAESATAFEERCSLQATLDRGFGCPGLSRFMRRPGLWSGTAQGTTERSGI
jgi:hypothetical protein